MASVARATTRTSEANRIRTSGGGDFASGVNVGGQERTASALGGAALALYGVSRASWGGLGLAVAGGYLLYRGLSGYCNLYRALGIDRAAGEGTQTVGNLGIKVDKAVYVNAPPEQVYAFWRNVENLPRFMSRVESVKKIDDKRSHWVIKGPAGKSIEWDAEIFNEVPNELIAWRSVNDADVEHAGSVRFERAQDERGTIVRVSLQYDPPGGVIGHAFAALWGEDAGQQIETDLANLKRAIESGAARSQQPGATGSQQPGATASQHTGATQPSAAAGSQPSGGSSSSQPSGVPRGQTPGAAEPERRVS